MSDIAIKVEGLSKSYLVGHNASQTERYTALRDVIARNARNLVRKTRDMFTGGPIVQGDEVEEFWALKDVSFEINQGDRVGIIGRNGAGKSTLLKILSRITEPTKGRIHINGRVASLLEVGTGFHPELTGRENIFLNGAILGMSRREIQHRFDDIVEFSEIEKFLDTPVKRYSSGMYVRLAFAVAAYLESEILLVDEVLAVGDREFQKKCVDRMEGVAGHGRTVLFVSHNMAVVRRLCRSGLYFKNGTVLSFSDVADAERAYLVSGSASSEWRACSGRSSQPADFFAPSAMLQATEHSVRLVGTISSLPRNLVIALRVLNSAGQELFWTTHRDASTAVPLALGECEFIIPFPDVLAPDDYTVELVTFLHNDKYVIPPEQGPRIRFAKGPGPRGSEFFDGGRAGLIRPLICWQRVAAIGREYTGVSKN
jgi:homopolymeric O-antigen transport system ATP-binding protein